MANDMFLECKATDVLYKCPAWDKLRKEVLERVCGALNTSHESDEDLAESEWTLEIRLQDKEHPTGFGQAMAERIEDKLNSMVQKSRFSQVFSLDEGKDGLTLRIRRNKASMATLYFKSPEPTEKGLVSINVDRFCAFMFGSCQESSDESRDESGDESGEEDNSNRARAGERRRNDTLPRDEALQKPLQNGETLEIQESPYLQFKSPDTKKTKENAEKEKAVSPTFSPTSGKDFVNSIWSRSTRTVGEYIAAFAKNKGKGGYYYSGLEEQKTEIRVGESKKKLLTSYKVRALELQDSWKGEIKEGLQRKVREEMLWVARDPSAGYRFLTPGEVEEGQVEVDFIEVGGRAKRGFGLYLLEVKVSPFDGVVFNDKEGPEAYILQPAPGPEGHVPVRLRKERWFQEMADYGWCSVHKRAKDVRCGTFFHCSLCSQKFACRKENLCISLSEQETACDVCENAENAENV